MKTDFAFPLAKLFANCASGGQQTEEQKRQLHFLQADYDQDQQHILAQVTKRELHRIEGVQPDH